MNISGLLHSKDWVCGKWRSFSVVIKCLAYFLVACGAANNAFAGNNTLSVTTPPPASANAGSSFGVTANLPYAGGSDCGNQVRIVSSGSCSGGSTSWTGSGSACAASGALTKTITMSAGALTACAISVDGHDSNGINGYPASVVYTVKINQDIVWSSVPASSSRYATDYTVSGTAKTSDGVASTGMGISYTSTTPGVCTITAGGVVHNVAVGTCTIQAVAASSANFTSASKTTSWPITKANQSITVTSPAPASAISGEAFSVAATATSGLPVAITVSGGCSISSGVVTMTSGTNACTVNYDQAGDGNNLVAHTSSVTTASKISQSITVTSPAPASAISGEAFGVAATATSNLPVEITVSGGCSISSGVVTMTSGTNACTVNYDQAGDDNNAAAHESSETTASKVSQSITVTSPAPASAISGEAFGVAATATSNLPVEITVSGGCSISDGVVTMTSGTNACTVNYDQAGDENNLAAHETSETTAAKVSQTITVTSPAPASAISGEAFGVAATATSNLPVAITVSGGCSISDGVVTMTSGTNACTVNYDQAGDENNLAAHETSETTAAKVSQSITVTNPAPASAVNGEVFGVAATTTSNLPVEITVSGGCSINSGVVSMTSGEEACTVNYDQAGDENNLAAHETSETAASLVFPLDSESKGSSIKESALHQ